MARSFRSAQLVITYEQQLVGSDLTKQVRRRSVGSIAWGEPIKADFSLGRLPCNFPSGVFSAAEAESGDYFASGDKVKINATLKSAREGSKLGASLVTVASSSSSSSSSSNRSSNSNNEIYSGHEPYNNLTIGTSIGVTYVVGCDSKFPASYLSEEEILCGGGGGGGGGSGGGGGGEGAEAGEGEGEEEGLQLGYLEVEWKPLPIPLFNEPQAKFKFHGPLKTEQAAMVRFLGPTIYVRDAPFHVSIAELKPEVKVGECTTLNVKVSSMAIFGEGTAHTNKTILLGADFKQIGYLATRRAHCD